jgi:hypothetical protein
MVTEAILTARSAPLTSAIIVSGGFWTQNEAGAPPNGGPPRTGHDKSFARMVVGSRA